MVAASTSPTAGGYRLVTAGGDQVAFGDAQTAGSLAGIALQAPVVAAAPC